MIIGLLLHFEGYFLSKISLFWSLEDLQAAEAALESSDEDNGGESPPPQKKARLTESVTSDLFALPASKTKETTVMHDEVRVTQAGGEKEQATNGDLPFGKLIANGGGDEVAVEGSSVVLKRKLSRFDGEVIRLIGQHLQNMGLQLVSILFSFLFSTKLKSFPIKKQKKNNNTCGDVSMRGLKFNVALNIS